MRKLMLAVAIAFTAVGCVSTKALVKAQAESEKAGYAKGFKDADGQCLQLQKRAQAAFETMQKELADKNARLEKFNQLDADKKLLEAKPKGCKLHPVCKKKP